MGQSAWSAVVQGTASFFFGKGSKGPIKADGENEPSTTSARGSALPYLIGRRRLGALIAWVGQRINSTNYAGGGGGGGGKGGGGGRKKGGAQPVATFSEKAWHVLCLGPAKKLHAIYASGKKIFPGPESTSPFIVPTWPTTAIDSTSHPSGSLIQLAEGSFKIFWGEETPAAAISELNQAAPNGLGIASKWPFLCSVYWTEYKLGQTPRWPLLEYEIETEVQESALVSCPSSLGTGVNPVHVLYQLLFGTFPYGLGLDVDDFDVDCMEVLATLAATEVLPSSILMQDGREIEGMVTDILRDLGAFMVWDIDRGHFVFKAIRPEALATTLPDHMVLPPLPEVRTEHHARKAADKLVYSFADEAKGYKPQTIGIDEDGQASLLNWQRAKRIEIPTTTQFLAATVIAERRAQEELASSTRYKLKLNRMARLIYPGVVFGVSGIAPTLRAMEVGLSPETDAVEIEAIPDYYATPKTTFSGTPSDSQEPNFPVALDLDFKIVEIPQPLLFGGPPSIVVPRIRASDKQPFADIWISVDGTTYKQVGRAFGGQAGGTLLDAMTVGDADWRIDQGPRFTALGPDVPGVLDLTGNDPDWCSCKQLAVIDGEVFALKKVTAVSGSTWRLDGLLRARFDTKRAAHAIGAKVFIFTLDELEQFSDDLFQPGQTLYVKTQPAGFSHQVDLAEVTAVSTTLQSKALVPMEPSVPYIAFGSGSGFSSPFYRNGNSVTLTWDYRPCNSQGTGAGYQGAGVGVGQWNNSVGSFEVRLYDTADVLKHTIQVANSRSTTISNATIIARFGSQVSFKAEVYAVNGGWRSTPSPKLTVEFI